ncbi:MAG: DUF4012 domain-containing protein [Dehalococcoidia bacterium]|nr:DUF4012 domain-containing protein [Dehalococcoidia bacterium]
MKFLSGPVLRARRRSPLILHRSAAGADRALSYARSVPETPLREWPARPVASNRRRKRRLLGRRRRRLLLRVALLALVILVGFRGYQYVNAYNDLRQAHATLRAAESALDDERLAMTPTRAGELRDSLDGAEGRFGSARDLIAGDPLARAAEHLPFVGDQVTASRRLAGIGEEAARLGQSAAGVLITFGEPPGEGNSLQSLVEFLYRAGPAFAEMEETAARIRDERSGVAGNRLLAPLARARDDIDRALERVDGILVDYGRARDLMPALLGYGGTQRYLILPQNNTELFPSGGLMSSYGVAEFEAGDLGPLLFEDFAVLFSRWQSGGGQYVEPPRPLRDHLLRTTSWGLGEAGWYPDFPRSARQAEFFTELGGVEPVDGVIAIDLFFMEGLLDLVGPIEIREFGVTVTSDTVTLMSLELTRDEMIPEEGRKVFLSYLAEAAFPAIFEAPRDRWDDLLAFFQRMADEKHIQVYSHDPATQELIEELGWDGGLAPGRDDFLLLADTSVNSTKLNLVVEQSIDLELRFNEDTSVDHVVDVTYRNELPTWAAGRDPELVQRLMLDGLYGDYLRLFAPLGSTLDSLLIDGQGVGAEAVEQEMGLLSFGRYFTVSPGAERRVSFAYDTPNLVEQAGGLFHYRLVMQKQAGTAGAPVSVSLVLPEGAVLEYATVDGQIAETRGVTLETDLSVDRVIEISYRLP